MQRKRQRATWDDEELQRLGAFDDDDDDQWGGDDDEDDSLLDAWDFEDGFIVPDNVEVEAEGSLDDNELGLSPVDAGNVLQSRLRDHAPRRPMPTRRSRRQLSVPPSPVPEPAVPRRRRLRRRDATPVIDLRSPVAVVGSGNNNSSTAAGREDDSSDSDRDRARQPRFRRLRRRRESTESARAPSRRGSAESASSAIPSSRPSSSIPTQSPVSIVHFPTQRSGTVRSLQIATQSSSNPPQSPPWLSSRGSSRSRSGRQ